MRWKNGLGFYGGENQCTAFSRHFYDFTRNFVPNENHFIDDYNSTEFVKTGKPTNVVATQKSHFFSIWRDGIVASIRYGTHKNCLFRNTIVCRFRQFKLICVKMGTICARKVSFKTICAWRTKSFDVTVSTDVCCTHFDFFSRLVDVSMIFIFCCLQFLYSFLPSDCFFNVCARLWLCIMSCLWRIPFASCQRYHAIFHFFFSFFFRLFGNFFLQHFSQQEFPFMNWLTCAKEKVQKRFYLLVNCIMHWVDAQMTCKHYAIDFFFSFTFRSHRSSSVRSNRTEMTWLSLKGNDFNATKGKKRTEE